MTKYILKYGFVLFAGFSLFFLLMYLLGYGTNPNLRIFNGIIHFVVLYVAIFFYLKQENAPTINYFTTMSVGMGATLLGAVPFCIVQAVHLSLNPEFMEAIKEITPLGEYLSPIKATVAIMAESVFAGFMSSYLITRLIESRANKPYTIAGNQPERKIISK